jgi:endonuclease/exonuclease/phosphatase family metal-dependent hydrolase
MPKTSIRFTLLIAVAFVCLACAGKWTGALAAEPAPEERQSVKVLSWNLEHFVDPYDDPYVNNDLENGPVLKSDAVLQSLAQSLRTINADIMCFQEVESDRAVKLFLDNYMEGHDYQYFAAVQALDWYQNVVIVSRLPILRIISLRERDMTSTIQNRTRRDVNSRLVAAEIAGPGGHNLFVVGVHLKAGRTDADVEWRTLQGSLIHDLLGHELRADPNLKAIVLGDFNMLSDSAEFTHITKAGPVQLSSPLEKWGFPFTHPADTPSRTLDYIFLSDSLLPFYVEDSAAVALPIPSRDMRAISDHLPVVTTLSFPKE